MSSPRIAIFAVAMAAGCGQIPAAMPDAGPDAPPGSTVYRGTLAATAATPFGGNPYCNYTMTLRDLETELALSTTGAVVGGSAQAISVEATVPPCPNPPIPPRLLKFTFGTATPIGGAIMVVLTGAATNDPRASLSMTVTPSGGALSAVSRWTRTDQPAPLDWSVTASLTLTVKPR